MYVYMYFLHSIGTCYFLLWICGFRNSDTVHQEEEDEENLINIGLAMCLIGWFFWMAHEVQATIAKPATASEYICEYKNPDDKKQKRMTSNDLKKYEVFFPSKDKLRESDVSKWIPSKEDERVPSSWVPSTKDQKDDILYIPKYNQDGEKKFHKLIKPGMSKIEYINYPVKAAAK